MPEQHLQTFHVEDAPGPAKPGASEFHPASFPGRMAYVLLWFPLSSETFIFKEVRQLREMGVPIVVYTAYSAVHKGLSREMEDYDGPLSHLGIKSSFSILRSVFRHCLRNPRLVWKMFRRSLFRRMRHLEAFGENSLCFFAGFKIADMALQDGITLLHSPWANGPATAVWVASQLTGIPFAFTGRAGDIYPEDGLLREKAKDALFIRTNNAANIDWLAQFTPDRDKIRLVYNSLTLPDRTTCKAPYQAPYRILSVGRFARTKGFPYLLTAISRLVREHVPVRLTLVGDGNWAHIIKGQIHRLGLEEVIELPGFVPNDRMASYLENHDMMVVPSVVHTNGDRDGIPNVIMEALSHRMPVIATDVCGIREVIRNGETGILLPQRDATAIADAIRWMIANREKALEMAAAGQKLIRKIFDSETNISQLHALYAGKCPVSVPGEHS